MKSRKLLSPLFEACNDCKSVALLHSHILKKGLIHDSFFATKLNSLHAKYTSLEAARKLFDETPHRTVYLWNATLRSYCRDKQWEEILQLFSHMISTPPADAAEKPDEFTIPIVLKACAGLLTLETGKMIHGLIKKCKISSDLFVGSAMIELYAKCGQMGDALRVFTEFPNPDVVLWTSMVTGYQQNGNAQEGLMFFSRMMLVEGTVLDPVTLVSVVSACAQSADFKLGRCVHGLMIRRGYETELILMNSILNFYAKTGSVDDATNLFRKMTEKDVVSWSCLIACYAQNEKPVEALHLFNEMVEKRIDPNSVTMVSALQACAAACDLQEGRKIHELVTQKGFEIDVSVSTALVDMYMKCSCLEDGVYLFKRMPKKDVVSWAALLSGYAMNGLANESIGVFRSMLSHDTRPDAVTMVKILSACSELGVLQQALCVHGYLVITGFEDKAFVGAALIDLYSKCGSLDDAIRVFEGMNERDVVAWSSMIAGYGIHGLGREAIRTFGRMIEISKSNPNQITFLSILAACSHTGLVEEGIKIFHMMVHEYQIEPNQEHYCIMVDLLGRMGRLDEAMEIIHRMPNPAGPHIWGALLGACRIHRNVKMGEIAAKNLFRLDPNHAGYYFLLSNIYAENEKWDDVANLKTIVKEKGLKKMPGHSLLEVGSKLHTFLVGDRLQPEYEKA